MSEARQRAETRAPESVFDTDSSSHFDIPPTVTDGSGVAEDATLGVLTDPHSGFEDTDMKFTIDEAAVVEASLSSDPVRAYLYNISRTPLLRAEEEVALAKQIEAGLLAHELMTDEERMAKAANEYYAKGLIDSLDLESLQADLRIISEQGVKAKEHFINANLRLVVSIATQSKFAGRGLEFLDLIQEGNIGLTRAVEMFDHTRGNKFSTYATWWIRQSISRAIADTGKTIKLPEHIASQCHMIRKEETLFFQKTGREATVEELAKLLEMDTEMIKKMQQFAQMEPFSFNRPHSQDTDAELAEFIVEEGVSEGPQQSLESSNARDSIGYLISTLGLHHRNVISLRFGLLDGSPKTLKQVGAVLGITKQRVKVLEDQAINKLRRNPLLGMILDHSSEN